MTQTGSLRRLRRDLMADPTFQAKVAVELALMMELDLSAARAATGLTQSDVAQKMRKSQENVSRIERQRDVRVSTLAAFVAAQGGELEITAVFPGRRVSLLRPVRT